MARRSVLLAAVAALSATMSLPALADEPKPGIGVAVQFAGEVLATTAASLPETAATNDGPRTIPGYDSHAICTFGGALLPNNTLDIAYGGVAWATAATVPARVPQQTILECRITNTVGNTANFVWTNGGPAATNNSIVTGWPVSPITICARSHVFYGPTDAFETDTGYQCGTTIAGG
jgi:hypothetical protein